MLHSDLRHPAPQIPSIGERRNRQHSKRCRRAGRKENRILPDHNRSVCPIHPHGGGAQAHESGVDPVRNRRKATARSSCRSASRLRTRHGRPECLEPDLRLPQRGTETSSGLAWRPRISERGKINAIHHTLIAHQIHQNNAREPHPILRRAFHFRLILIVHFPAQQLVFLFQAGRVLAFF
jgi:hypothetical protein